MGNANSKKNFDSIEQIEEKSIQQSQVLKREKEGPKTQYSIPLNSSDLISNKEFLNELSLFIVKAYDKKFNGTFTDFMVMKLLNNMYIYH